jgi:hypothetical protein
VIEEIRRAFAAGRIRWRQHALERMLARGITRVHVSAVVASGHVIEEYTSDRPYPACLVHEELQGRPLHVVIAYNKRGGTAYVITAYQPDEQHFQSDFKTRKKRPQ